MPIKQVSCFIFSRGYLRWIKAASRCTKKIWPSTLRSKKVGPQKAFLFLTSASPSLRVHVLSASVLRKYMCSLRWLSSSWSMHCRTCNTNHRWVAHVKEAARQTARENGSSTKPGRQKIWTFRSAAPGRRLPAMWLPFRPGHELWHSV